MMYKVSREFMFAAGHSVTGYPGNCARLHGHGYRVIVTIKSPKLNGLGMVMDFSDLKVIVDGILNELDHYFLIWRDDPRAEGLMRLDASSIRIMEYNPTAENIAEHIKDGLRDRLLSPQAVDSVVLYETPNCSAIV